MSKDLRGPGHVLASLLRDVICGAIAAGDFMVERIVGRSDEVGTANHLGVVLYLFQTFSMVQVHCITNDAYSIQSQRLLPQCC